MSFSDWLPWNWGKHDIPVKQVADSNMLSLQRDMNQVFDNFLRRFDGFEMSPLRSTETLLSGISPKVDVTETDEEIEVCAELPGVDEDDIDLSLSDQTLTLRAEKHSEREEKNKHCYLTERSHGSIYRQIALPAGVDRENVSAEFRKGVLRITLPKTELENSDRRRIPVRSASE